MANWVVRWKYEMSEKPVMKGVWRLKQGGFYVRARPSDPRTGKIREISRPVFDVKTAREALLVLQEHIDFVRSGGDATNKASVSFREFAGSCMDRKIEEQDLKSAASRQKWRVVLDHHLVPAFGDFFMDKISRHEVMAWRDRVNKLVQSGEYSPNTANDWLAILRVIVKSYLIENQIENDPVANVRNFRKAGFRSYTEEEPNSLLPEEVPFFLARMKDVFPQHHAFVALGFITGLRPSTLRPLRRNGKYADILWSEGALLARRSQTMGEEVMGQTKTGLSQRIALPRGVMELLRKHVEQLPEGPMVESELLFPSEVGGFRARSVLDKPFAQVCTSLGLRKRVTPRAMRRTFQDLARAASVKDVVTRAVSGHATEAMQRHYSTVNDAEMRESLEAMAVRAGLGSSDE